MPLRSVIPGPEERDESRARSGARLLVNRCNETVERRARKEERGCDITHAVVHSQKGTHYIALAWSEAICLAEALEGPLKREGGWRCRCRLARVHGVLLRRILSIDVGSGGGSSVGSRVRSARFPSSREAMRRRLRAGRLWKLSCQEGRRCRSGQWQARSRAARRCC